MAEFLADLRDVQFVLFEQLKVQELLGKEPYADFDRETLEMMLGEAARFAKEVLGPLNETSDRVGARYEDGEVTLPPGTKEAFQAFAENGWCGVSAPPELGGQGAPEVLAQAASELFGASCLAFNLTRILTTGAAHLIQTFGTDEQRSLFVERMYEGRWTGSMCLTEADAGTDVGASRTSATPEGDHYLIEGEKIFITSGEHDLTENIIHAVLARTPDAPAGTKGLSLFIVPKVRVGAGGVLGEPNHVSCLGIEKKLGIHGSPTCVLGFGQSGPCHGYLLGKEGAGMRQMFQMMNEARLSVGLEGAGLGNAAYLQALSFTKERIQGRDITRRQKGRVAIVEHPDVRRMLLWQKAHAEGARALGYYAAACIDRTRVAKAAGDEETAARWWGILEVLTPIVKAYCSDVGFKVCDQAVQCCGGYGYTRDYPVEQYLRDSRISRIYEGANGVQALDLVGRKLGQRGGLDARATFEELTRIAGEIEAPRLERVAARVKGALASLGRVAQGFAAMAGEDPLGPVVNAYGFLELMGDVCVGTLLGQQAGIAARSLEAHATAKGVDPTDDEAVRAFAADDGEARFLWGKVTAARFFAERVLSLVPARGELLLGADRSAMDMVF